MIKTEAGEEGEEELSEGLSDTERTFPTYSRQPPLRYSSPKVKEEKEEKGQIPDVPVAGVDADDEDEDADFLADEPAPLRGGLHSDSGLGTSLESSGPRREAVRRRRSGGGDFHET